MFAETLLESSNGHKRKRWPMATAFTAQTVIATVIVIVPLLSTGVIPLSARTQIVAPLNPMPLERVKPKPSDGPRKPGAVTAERSPEIVLVSNSDSKLSWGKTKITTTDPNEATPGDPNLGRNDAIPDLGEGSNSSNVKPEITRVVSQLTEAQLTNRVEPVYPKPAVLANVQGQVKLHAIIARNGKIESLEVISGHPLLVQAALDAVRQWRYRPYYLNGQAVEVETFITVNFRRDGR